MLRKCSKCGVVKDLDEFINRKDRPYGKGYWCKDCLKIINRANRKRRYANPEIRKQNIEKSKQYYTNHRDERIQKMNEYYSDNKKKLLAQEKEKYMANPEKKRKSSNDYRKRKMAENPNWKKTREMAYKLKKSFKEVEEWFNHQWLIQQAQCAICGKVFCGDDCIDHDHDTLELRCLLCSGCNLGIGHLRDSADICIKAADYLKKYKS